LMTADEAKKYGIVDKIINDIQVAQSKSN
jgi:ATP-dependent protease ClpP protease subunit